MCIKIFDLYFPTKCNISRHCKAFVFIFVYGMSKTVNLILLYSVCITSYGENCLYPCSKNCVNQTCNRFHGICQFGCESGYHGQKCDKGIYTWIIINYYYYTMQLYRIILIL